MTSIRKFAYAAVLAATTLNFAPTLATAQESARGKFTLTHDVRWGAAKVPAGDYSFAYDLSPGSRTLSLTKLSGTRAGYLLLVTATDDNNSTDDNRLVLESGTDGSYVTAMKLPKVGMTLYFPTPSHSTNKQIAATVTTASAAAR